MSQRQQNTESGSSEAIDNIIQAASQNFAQRGFGGARVDEIAKIAKVNKATIYYHVGDKAALYREVIKNTFATLVAELEEKIFELEDPEEQLRVFINTIFKNVGSDKNICPIIMREVAGGAENMPIEALEYIQKIIGTLNKIISHGARLGRFNQVNPMLTHMIIVGFINFQTSGAPLREMIRVLNPDLITEGESTQTKVEEFLHNTLLNGIIKRA